MAKRQKKQRRIRAVDDDDRPSRQPNKNTNKSKKHTNFANDLVDTSRNTTKRLRYDANQAQRGKALGKRGGKGKPVKGKPPKGKTFGKPQAGKGGKNRKK